jgi:sugar phosphate isomerase/epimerase
MDDHLTHSVLPDPDHRPGASVSRRRLLRAGGALLAGLAVPFAYRRAWGVTDPEPPFRISLAEWSLHRTIFAGDLGHLDFPRIARGRFGIDAVEYVNQFFPDKAGDRRYLAEMKQRADDAGVQSLLIMVDREGDLGHRRARKRLRAVENHCRWVDAAKTLGCHSVRVNAVSSGSYADQVGRAADGLHRLTLHAAEREMNVLVENHGGLSSNAAWLASVIREVDHPRCGTLPDFGNFRLPDGRMGDRYAGVRRLMPFAKAVSAKSHDFDGDGNERHTDYRRMLEIVVGGGYHGYIGIEYEGKDLDEFEGIRRTKTLLARCRQEMVEPDA